MAERNETHSPAIERARWRAVQRRQLGECVPFVYAVVTTGVYCRPECTSRQPKRSNVRYFDTATAAERAGYRACKRCRPAQREAEPGHLAAIRTACRQLADRHQPPSVTDLAGQARLSDAQFRRVFKQIVGVTPKQYQAAVRRCSLQERLGSAASVTAAIYDAGFRVASQVYERTGELLGMTPAAYRQRGRRQAIRYAVGPCSLGLVLVAVTERGICAIQLGDDADALVAELHRRFSAADVAPDDALAEVLAIVVGYVDRPALGLHLPLDIQGTAFQQRVWQALQQIPAGETRTYSEVAAQLGTPTATRAVARACATNRIAVAIPCHRVVGKSGQVTGYFWGVERKQALLEREAR